MKEQICITNLYEYLDQIQKRPGLFLGGKSLTALYYVIEGYQRACSLKNIDEELVPNLQDFHDFVNNYYLHGSSTAGWKNVILAQNYGMEDYAFDNFFRLLNLFKEGYPKVNSRKIILHLIQKMVDDAECLSPIADSTIVEYLKNLPSKLQEGQSLFDYDSILFDFKEMAHNSDALSTLISGVAGSSDWLTIEP